MVQHIVARYGEMSLKGKNRSEFERLLLRNIRAALRPWPGAKAERIAGRVMITLEDEPVEPILERLRRVFGLTSLSPVEVVNLDLDAFRSAAIRVLQSTETPTGRPPKFKVEVKRTNKRFPLNSPQVADEVGGACLRALPQWRVDVHHPDVTVYIHIRDEEAHVYGRVVPGVGGMPAHSAGKAGLLLSGGIDSPVAGWLGMKRGVTLEAIHFHSFPFTSERALEKVETLAQILAGWGGPVTLHTVHFTDVQTAIRKHCPAPLYITIMRRMMLRIADRIAQDRGLLALMTGESLGQVASQTLESMRTINAVTNLPVLRPLVGMDKVEIIRMAREIGTYETSILPYEDCCTIFVPPNPRTKPRVEEAEAAEEHLPVEELVEGAVARTTMKTFHAEDSIAD
ncbi:tRNA uracil 4-sulfurtransferase ThiI [Alicyclobacillus macrosporangiidus]|uniref:tRNA uracil 4-sulfurtransferase ThiI n=1 Tax=Alicyclobacillus macrosporangiidus TaxID=392015 RepID=UPI000495CC4E|nr:tRNA uracil 4-sulfurtransferase ThiI [Alicyclobacillus macrosporangiidus]MCL6599071.1 tRNA 4-thiouridine(8) synthase ThiI [Alicyclobacillus macrosporangiidus]